MPQHNSPSMICQRHYPTLTVSDIKTAVDYYTTKLGFTLGFLWSEPPTYAGVTLDKVSIHLSQGTPIARGNQIYFVIDNADAFHAFHARNGVKILNAPTNRPWEMRDYAVEDLDGHTLVFGSYLPCTEPKLEIERVDVPVRLEKRLASLLADLAEHKRMTIGECLEETLLHTFKKVEHDGVASPHLEHTFSYIETLKSKHGIDYDTHASYRFIEKADS